MLAKTNPSHSLVLAMFFAGAMSMQSHQVVASPKPTATKKSVSNASILLRGSTYRESLRSAKKTLVVGVPIAFADGILFTYLGEENDQVRVSGSFLGWRTTIPLKRTPYGVYSIFVRMDLRTGDYAYRFLVNNIWVNDPKQPFRTNDGYGTQMSFFRLSRATVVYGSSPKRLARNRYLFFLKDKGYERVSWVGSANLWDPSLDPMKLVDGYWVIRKTIEPNRRLYKFVVDGEKTLDPENEFSARTHHSEEVNVVPTE